MVATPGFTGRALEPDPQRRAGEDPGCDGDGDAFMRDPALVREDVRLGRYGAKDADALFGVALQGAFHEIEDKETARLRSGR